MKGKKKVKTYDWQNTFMWENKGSKAEIRQAIVYVWSRSKSWDREVLISSSMRWVDCLYLWPVGIAFM